MNEEPLTPAERLVRAVPAILLGLAVGAGGTTGIAVGADLVVFQGVHETRVREARVRELGRVCELIVERNWREANESVAELQGWAYGNVRYDLAKETLSWLVSDDGLAADARAVCIRRLET